MTTPSRHWAQHQERGSFWLMKLTATLVRLLGRRVLSPLIHVIVGYFFLFGRRARRSAWQYQQRLSAWNGGQTPAPSQWQVFRQFMAFADALLDKLDVWNGRLRLEDIEIDDPAQLRTQLRGERGQMLVGAHLGNLEVCRALAELGEQVTMNVLVHTRHAERFNRLLGEAGATNLRLIQVSELDPAVMLQLSERLERGEWLAIGCPLNLLFCLKLQGRYRVTLEPFAERVQWRRGQRDQVIAEWTTRYAQRLAHYCSQAPLQWFNFYPFWKTDDDASA